MIPPTPLRVVFGKSPIYGAGSRPIRRFILSGQCLIFDGLLPSNRTAGVALYMGPGFSVIRLDHSAGAHEKNSGPNHFLLHLPWRLFLSQEPVDELKTSPAKRNK